MCKSPDVPGGHLRYPIGIAVTVIAFAIAGNRALWLFRLVMSGKPAPGRTTGIPSRIMAELTEVVGQRKLLKKTVPGLAHAFTFWGFSFLLLTVIEAVGDLFDKTFAIPLIGHYAAIGFLEDFFAVAVLLALCVFTIIRIRNAPARRQKASRFYGSHTGAAWVVLIGIAGIMITLLVYRAAQVNTGDFPYNGSRWAFASHILSHLFRGLSYQTNYNIESVFVVANVALIMAFGMVYVPYTKHLHIFVAPLNVLFSRRPKALGPLGTTPKMDVEEMGEDDVFGAGLIEHFSWKQMLDMITCTECGRCQEQCPAWNTDKPLSPKLLIMDLRDHLFKSAPELIGAGIGSKNGSANGTAASDSEVQSGGSGDGNPKKGSTSVSLVPNVIDPDVLWACTTCGACVEACPVDIEHVDAIVDMRRYQVLMESEFPTEAGTMLRNVENQGDPWG
ncbi:MAG TPA: (Fe-S)-binding protein, partial [Acidimicrobiales bacterium]|nr:(Fe-S)-binding protein [Acidimicrobiales bacterium]